MRTDSPSSAGFFGRSVLRVEDHKLLRGAGRFVDDIALPGVLHAAFVRSPIAHGRLRRIDAAAARALEGVQAVLTYADLRPLMSGDRIPLALPSAAIRFDVDPVWLAKDEVCHVGEPVAMVVAASRRVAEDAARLVALDIEPLPAVVDPLRRPSRRARRRRGSTVPTISSPAQRSITATSTGLSPAPRTGSPSASTSTRAAAIRSSRAA